MKSCTIVIATAIRDSLIETLRCINNSTFTPEEVILSIPKGKTFNINEKFKFKIRIISKEIGQVSQRIEGFKLVRTNLCIQMDDDIFFDRNFLELFISSFNKLPSRSALAPLYGINKEILSVLISPKIYFSNILFYILDSKFKPNYGSITKVGFPIGINPKYDSKFENPIVETQWINGCCVIYNSKYLIKNWKYPYKGKAYAEDLLHSKFLAETGISLYVDRSLMISLKEDKKINKIYSIYMYFKAKIISYKAINSLKNSRYSFARYITFTLVYIFLKGLSNLIRYFKNRLNMK